MFYDIGYHGLGDNMGQFSGSRLAIRKLQIMIFLGGIISQNCFFGIIFRIQKKMMAKTSQFPVDCCLNQWTNPMNRDLTTLKSTMNRSRWHPSSPHQWCVACPWTAHAPGKARAVIAPSKVARLRLLLLYYWYFEYCIILFNVVNVINVINIITMINVVDNNYQQYVSCECYFHHAYQC